MATIVVSHPFVLVLIFISSFFWGFVISRAINRHNHRK